MRLFLIVSLFFFISISGSASAELSLIGGKVNIQTADVKMDLPLDDGAIIKVDNSDYVFVFISDIEALKAAGQKSPSLVFFDQGGKMVGAYAGNEKFDPEMCSSASLSPGKKILALDNGTWLLRVWTFLNFPDLTPASTVEDPYLSYFSSDDFPSLTWVNDNTVLVTDVSETSVARPCPADPCEPLDVVVHYIKEWDSSALANGTELCDYNLESVSKNIATVLKTCTKTIDDWGSDDQSIRTKSHEKITITAR